MVLAVTVLVAGCGSAREETAAEPAATRTPSSTSTLTPEPSAPTSTPTGSSESPSPSPTPSAPPKPARALTDRLLPAAALPGFNESFTWELEGSAPREPAEALQCHSFGLLSIGAKAAAHRTYVPADGSTSSALEIVADFPDAMTAKRALSVLQSWYRDCPRDHDGDPQVGPYAAVTLATTGSAGWHLLTYGTTFDAHGIVQRGARIAVVVLTLRDAQDYNHEPGQEPMVTALQRAAALL